MEPIENRRGEPEIDAAAEDRQRASRRAAILNGLGKGSVAMAALSPLASQASRSHKLFNPNFGASGADCYCTVSGFQSAAISQIPAVTCGTYNPAHFVAKTALNQNYATFTNSVLGLTFYDDTKIKIVTGSGNGAKDGPADLAKAMNTHFNLSPGTITRLEANGLLNGNSGLGTSIVRSDLSFLAKPRSPNNSFDAYQGKNFGSDIATASFNASGLFTSADSRTLLEVLNDSTASTAKPYFLACYLSIGKSGVQVPTDLTRTYVKANYTDSIAANLSSNESLFFKAISNLP